MGSYMKKEALNYKSKRVKKTTHEERENRLAAFRQETTKKELSLNSDSKNASGFSFNSKISRK